MFDRTRRARLVLVLLIATSLVLITMDFRSKGDGPLDRIGHVALAILGPVQKGLVTIFRPVGNFAAGFTRVPSLRARISTLEQRIALLQAERERFIDIERENRSLRKQLGLGERLDLKTISAAVIGVGPSNFERTIFIGRGSDGGVRKDMPVIAGEGLAGRVISVGPSSAEVVLIVDRSSAVAGRLASNGETGLIRGTGSGRVDFELFDPEAKVGIGDRVVTSGYDQGIFPPGIPVGTVTKASPARSNLLRVVQVQPFVDFSSLDYVLLVIGPKR